MRQRGFTLVEVLVAIAIFAVLSAAGWQVFDQLIKTRERNQQHAKHLMQLQTAYAQLLRDVNQMVPLAGKQRADSYPALLLENQVLQFNKAGVIDPLQQGLDQYEFVEYRYDAQKQALLRYKAPYIYRQDLQNMQADVVLAPIEDLSFRALDPAVQERWPSQTVTEVNAAEQMLAQLPKGIEVRFSYQNKSYRWLFALVGGLPINTAPEEKPNANPS